MHLQFGGKKKNLSFAQPCMREDLEIGHYHKPFVVVTTAEREAMKISLSLKKKSNNKWHDPIGSKGNIVRKKILPSIYLFK